MFAHQLRRGCAAAAAQLSDRFVEIDRDAAIRAMLPLAKNYLNSDVYKRVEAVPKIAEHYSPRPAGLDGLWSELSFRLRRRLGVLNGIIDKLLITHQHGERDRDHRLQNNRIVYDKSETPREPPRRDSPPKTAIRFRLSKRAAAKPVNRHPSLEEASEDCGEDYNCRCRRTRSPCASSCRRLRTRRFA
jgi:hypothetical protein